MSAPTATNEVSSSPKRSWRRFTLRALFLVILAAGIFFGWVAYRVRQFHEQGAFIADLRERGFRSVETEPARENWFWEPLVGDDAVQVKSASLDAPRPGNQSLGTTADDLKRIADWTGIKSLQLYGASVTDETLRVLRNFKDLESLALYQTAISDAGLRHLKGLNKLTYLAIGDYMPNHDRAYGTLTSSAAYYICTLTELTTLDLYGVSMDEESLRLIVETLPGLRNLELEKCGIADEGLKHVAGLAKLSRLCIPHNPRVTDVGLRYLANVRALDFLDVCHTGVSPEEARAFRARRPEVNLSAIEWSEENPFQSLRLHGGGRF